MTHRGHHGEHSILSTFDPDGISTSPFNPVVVWEVVLISHHLKRQSGLSSGEITCLIVRHFPASLLLWIKFPSRHCAQCSSKICSPDRWRRRKRREGCGTDKEPIGSSLMWMVHDRRPANVRCHPLLIFLQPSAVWTRYVLQATQAASGEKPSALRRPCSRPTRTSGSVRFRGQRERATVSIGASCDKRSKRSARICRRNPFH